MTLSRFTGLLCICFAVLSFMYAYNLPYRGLHEHSVTSWLDVPYHYEGRE